MNLIWMNRIYSSFCSDYLVKSRPERTVDMMEKVLFLMQVESLQKQMPLLPCKIFLDGSHIRIPYISDLLAVHQKALFLPNSSHYMFRRSFDEYAKMLNRLRRLDEVQLNERVMKVLQNADLDRNYFVYAPYEHRWLRRLARLKIQTTLHWVINLVRIFLFVPLPAVLIALVMVQAVSEELRLPIDYQRMWVLILMGVFTFITALQWTISWMKPTAYEQSHFART